MILNYPVLPYLFLPQIGFGLYPVIVRKYATAHKANPVIFSFYRYVCSDQLPVCHHISNHTYSVVPICLQGCLLYSTTVHLCDYRRTKAYLPQTKDAFCELSSNSQSPTRNSYDNNSLCFPSMQLLILLGALGMFGNQVDKVLKG